MRISDWSSDVCSSDLSTECGEGSHANGTGTGNTAVGAGSLANGDGNTAIGAHSIALSEESYASGYAATAYANGSYASGYGASAGLLYVKIPCAPLSLSPDNPGTTAVGAHAQAGATRPGQATPTPIRTRAPAHPPAHPKRVPSAKRV